MRRRDGEKTRLRALVGREWEGFAVDNARSLRRRFRNE
jgi:hypothetical protein